MGSFATISVRALGWFFQLIDLVIWARVILSFVVMFMGRQLKIYDIICMFTEPMLVPIRKLLNKSEFLQNTPIDFSLLVLWLLVGFIKTILIGY